MTIEGEQIINEILHEFSNGLPFTIEEFTRKYLERKNVGEHIEVHEVEAQDFIEKHLKNNNLIIEVGKATLYKVV
jgi:hypothetical protein